MSDESLNSSEVTSFAQKLIILVETSISRGYIPNYPYIMFDGVLFLRPKRLLKNLSCALSRISNFPNPHISHP